MSIFPDARQAKRHPHFLRDRHRHQVNGRKSSKAHGGFYGFYLVKAVTSSAGCLK
jgi:hypothetical protein